ncbi:MAG: hypothetical protein ACXU9U_03085 [Parachlamydiaceae bacterium]
MRKQSHKKLTVEFSTEEYIFLKMICAKQGIFMKDFATGAIR